MNSNRSLRSIGTHLWDRTLAITAGGTWSTQLDRGVQRNLRAFFFDGLFSSANDNIILTYLTLFLLALGASESQIGLLSSLASLMAVALLMPGAILSDRAPSRKWVVLLGGGVVSRLCYLFMALLPFFLHGTAAIWVVIGLKVLADGMGNLAFPAWTSLTADIVPLQWRGRFFGTRNIIMGVAGMSVTYLIGHMITSIDSLSGYQIALGIAVMLGFMATFSYSRIQEPPKHADADSSQTYSLRSLWQTLLSSRPFMLYCGFALIWNFSLNIAGPFFNVYMVNNLKASATMVGVISIASMLAGLPAQRFFGGLVDRWGSRRVLLLTSFLIPLLPFAWAFTTQPWHPILINIAGGILWAGNGLASFNMLLSLAPGAQRARFSALYQIAVALACALGAAVGGLVVTHLGYQALFISSSAGRIVAAFFFLRFVKQEHAS